MAKFNGAEMVQTCPAARFLFTIMALEEGGLTVILFDTSG
jgi:hypothetical protein